jgi:RNA polymerase sigma factor (sigma-70 family)
MTTTIPSCVRLRAHRLAAANDKLAFWAVGQFLGLTPAHDDWDDAVQEARMAILDAALHFDSDRGIQFSTYAGRTLYNRLVRWREINLRQGFTRIGDSMARSRGKVVPTPCRAKLSDVAFAGLLAVTDPKAAALDADELRRAMSRLPKRTRDILHSRYWTGETLAETGKRFGITKSRVRQIEQKGLDRLRDLLGES